MRDPFDILDQALLTHRPITTFGLFSGGDDSLATLLALSTWARARQVVWRAAHIDTGTGIPETSQFVIQTCGRECWNLDVHRTPATRYEQMVLGYANLPGGFPGPALHRYYYQRLKDRRIADIIAYAKTGHRRSDRVMLVSGVRQLESRRRMGYDDPIQRRGAAVWVNPLFYWSKDLVLDRIERRMRNPASCLMHISGECLCGCMARPGELDEIRFWFPDTAARIDALARRAHENGFHWEWGGGGRPKDWLERRDAPADMPLCSSCASRQSE
jgi:3'-phosphoadenosine 5'-phosphosulfate sulfotransferase (PAPS reductase)/FAD synthetase